MRPEISSSLEDYLEAIAELTAKSGHAHTKDIADLLSVKMPSVTGALKLLSKRGFIVYRRSYPVELTAQGKAIAERVIRRHGILERFFSEVFKLDHVKADETACRIEHLVDEDVIDRFVILSQAIAGRPDCEPLRAYLGRKMRPAKVAKAKEK